VWLDVRSVSPVLSLFSGKEVERIPRTLRIKLVKTSQKAFDVELMLETKSRFSPFTKLPGVLNVSNVIIENPDDLPLKILKDATRNLGDKIKYMKK